MSNPRRMALTIHNRRLFAQHARPSDDALPYADSASKAADMLISGVPRVQMAYDTKAGSAVKDDLRAAGVIA